MGGKSGPCTHCGITATPLWRRGPPEKPILCNACGSRWRHRGTLAGYMPMQVTGLSTCHVPCGYTIPEEPQVPKVKPAGSLKRKEFAEEDNKGMADRLRERKETDGYRSNDDDSEVSLSRQSARRKVSPSCSPISVLPPPRRRPPLPKESSSWGHISALFSDLHDFDLDLTSAQAFEGLDNDVSLFNAEAEPCKEELKTLDAGQYICGLVVRTKVEALGGPVHRSSSPLVAPSDARLSVPKDAPDAKESSATLPLSSSARFALPSRAPPPESTTNPSWPDVKPGPVAVNVAKLQGADSGKSSPHRASFSEKLLFRGGESLNEFMARTGGEKRSGELAGSHEMQGSYDSLDSGASLVLDETCEPAPVVDLNPPPPQHEQPLSSKGEKDLNELHSLFLEPIWDSFDLEGGAADKSFLSVGGQS